MSIIFESSKEDPEAYAMINITKYCFANISINEAKERGIEYEETDVTDGKNIEGYTFLGVEKSGINPAVIAMLLAEEWNILGYQVGEFIPKSTLKKRYISHINQKVRERAGTDNK